MRTLVSTLLALLAGLPGTGGGAGSAPSIRMSLPCTMQLCDTDMACWDCQWPETCNLGETVAVRCEASQKCSPRKSLLRRVPCLFCWQTKSADHDCRRIRNCSTTSTALHTTFCRVKPDVICKGSRIFYKNIRCKWSAGYSWWRALILSLTLGGFGADRFYLGLWKSGIGKLFSFGGLGIWTVVDVALIATGYIRPADGSSYV